MKLNHPENQDSSKSSEEMSWKYRINYFQHEKNLIPINDIIAKYRDWETDRKSTRLNSSHRSLSRMPSSA